MHKRSTVGEPRVPHCVPEPEPSWYQQWPLGEVNGATAEPSLMMGHLQWNLEPNSWCSFAALPAAFRRPTSSQLPPSSLQRSWHDAPAPAQVQSSLHAMSFGNDWHTHQPSSIAMKQPAAALLGQPPFPAATLPGQHPSWPAPFLAKSIPKHRFVGAMPAASTRLNPRSEGFKSAPSFFSMHT